MNKKLISIICPIFNEKVAIPLFYERLMLSLLDLFNIYDFELIFTNNCSTDNSLEAIIELRNKWSQVQVLTFSRNFGYQASITAGLMYAAGDAVIVIDVDCEDPPEMLPDFIKKWSEGNNIVFGIRQDREEYWVLKKSRILFYRLLHLMSDMDTILYMAEFMLISKTVRNSVLSNRNTYPFIRAEVGYAGFSRCGVSYKRKRRITGKTHYNLWKMTSFAVTGILTSSTFLLRLPFYCFLGLCVFNAFYISNKNSTAFSFSFETTIIVDILFLFFSISVISLYIARIYKTIIGRPIFIIDPEKTFINREFQEIFKKNSL